MERIKQMENLKVRIVDKFLLIEKDGKVFRFNVNDISERLASATNEELLDFSLSPSGYGITWKKLDEDYLKPMFIADYEVIKNQVRFMANKNISDIYKVELQNYDSSSPQYKSEMKMGYN